MKDQSKSPEKYGWIETLLPGEFSHIKWNLRAGAYNYARKHGIKITVRKAAGNRAKVIRLED